MVVQIDNIRIDCKADGRIVGRANELMTVEFTLDPRTRVHTDQLKFRVQGASASARYGASASYASQTKYKRAREASLAIAPNRGRWYQR